MDDRRVFERREAAVQAEVSEAVGGRVIGLLADISSGGMMLRTEAPLARGERLRLRVELPPDGEDPDTLTVEAAVRWCEPDLEPSTHLVGLEFAGRTPPRSALIEEIRRRLSQAR